MILLILNLLSQWKIKFYLILAFASFFINGVFAQEKASITEYLGSAFESNLVKSDLESVSFLKNYNYNLPLIKSIDLRSETRDFLFQRQEYTMRIKPNSLKAIDTQKKIYQNKLEKVKLDNQFIFNQALKKRYLLLVDYLFTEQEIKLETKKLGNLNDKLAVSGQKIYETNFDIKELIKSEDELLKLKLKLSNLKNSQERQYLLLIALFNFRGDSLMMVSNDLISPEQIIENTRHKFSEESLEIKQQKLKLITLENEMEFNHSKSNQLLDYVQAKYTGDDNIIFDETISIGIGINLPFFGSNRQRKGDYYFEKLDEENELKQLVETKEYDENNMRNEFTAVISNYKILTQHMEESSVSSLLETYEQMDGVSPLLLLNLVIMQNERELQALKSKHQLYKLYIERLAIQGALFQHPLRNYLSASREFIR